VIAKFSGHSPRLNDRPRLFLRTAWHKGGDFFRSKQKGERSLIAAGLFRQRWYSALLAGKIQPGDADKTGPRRRQTRLADAVRSAPAGADE
jgi:hypothetical protein